MSVHALKSNWRLDDLEALFKEFPILATFPGRVITELAKATDVVEVPPNTQLLQQGQVNDSLFFLVDGTVGVYVDGGRVSKMQRKGDLIGEMSVISKKPVGATILSETHVILLRVSSQLFLNSAGPDKDLYLSILYRIYATVLAEKLHDTNQKAKRFEEMTIQLTATQEELQEINENLEKKVEERTQKLEQQNAALMASSNKLTELLNSKHVLFKKLGEFHDKHLAPLKSLLDQMRLSSSSDPIIDEARTVVFEVQQLLGPLNDQYSSEQQVQGKRVLLADTNKKQQIIAKMALGGTGVHLDLVSTLEEGKEKIENGTYDLVAIDAPMLELGNLVRSKMPSARLVLMTSDQIPSYLPALRQLSHIPHIVSRDEADRTFTIKNIMTTVTKLLSNDLFGLEKYMSWGVDVQTRPIVSSKSRPDLIQEVDKYFEKVGIRRANRDRIKLVLEEMLMNAIYDAPHGSDGKSLYNHLPRTVDVSLRPAEQGLLRFATDGMLIAISVQDPFGGLKGSTILRYLEHNYAGSAGDINAQENKGGAGRGLHQIVESSDLVVFNVDSGKKTEVIALFNVEAKEKANLNPSFHLFLR